MAEKEKEIQLLNSQVKINEDLAKKAGDAVPSAEGLQPGIMAQQAELEQTIPVKVPFLHSRLLPCAR